MEWPTSTDVGRIGDMSVDAHLRVTLDAETFEQLDTGKAVLGEKVNAFGVNGDDASGHGLSGLTNRMAGEDRGMRLCFE